VVKTVVVMVRYEVKLSLKLCFTRKINSHDMNDARVVTYADQTPTNPEGVPPPPPVVLRTCHNPGPGPNVRLRTGLGSGLSPDASGICASQPIVRKCPFALSLDLSSSLCPSIELDPFMKHCDDKVLTAVTHLFCN
jgi:hypothetical protein